MDKGINQIMSFSLVVYVSFVVYKTLNTNSVDVPTIKVNQKALMSVKTMRSNMFFSSYNYKE
jgi:hypothetical protein